MKFEKGNWYSDGKRFYQYDCESHPTKNTHYEFRIAGCNEPSAVFYRLNDLAMLTPASLTPDFSNAKEGDECFSAEEGLCKIMDDTSGKLIAAMNEDGGWDAFTKDGKLDPESNHPLLFNSFAQFLAYWQEEALKLKGGESE